VLTNDESVTSEAIELSRELFGNEKVWDMPVRMSSEDFSFFSVKYPSVLFRLGITPPGTISQRLHTASFDIDEKAMAAGISNMMWLTLRMLNNINPKEK